MESPHWPEDFCDLVMEGGVTSGVVYPSAVVELAQFYRFRSIGGTSAGAIAAAATAAAELDRRNAIAVAAEGGNARQPSGFEILAALPTQLATGQGGTRLFDLFQPEPETRPLFRMLSSALNRKSRTTLVLGLIAGGLSGFWLCTAVGAASVLTVALLCGSSTLLEWLPWILLSIVGAFVGFAIGFYRAVTGKIVDNGYGLCRGYAKGAEERAGPEPLTLWLSRLINRCAGRDPDGPPVTFGELWAAPGFPPDWLGPVAPGAPSIRLEMITTNLTQARPYRFPLDEDERFYFKQSELEHYFPKRVVEHLVARSQRVEPRPSEPPTKPADLRMLPSSADLPIVFAARLSLSFPLLISAVPLWTTDFEAPVGERQYRRCWFSDGGIASNFPIHFFDSAALPLWPTFGIELEQREHVTDDGETTAPYGGRVWMPARNVEGRADPWLRFDEAESSVARLGKFLAAIFDTAQSWRDSCLARTLGVRDRIVRVRLEPNEGGLNLDMEKTTLDALQKAGLRAGRTLVDRFVRDEVPPGGEHAMGWDNHRWMRFRALLAALEPQLHALARSITSVPPHTTPLQALVERSPTASNARPDEYRVDPAVAAKLIEVFGSLEVLVRALDMPPEPETTPPRTPVARLVPDL
jgi:predicted acylesterase/phospholipase RssA